MENEAVVVREREKILDSMTSWLHKEGAIPMILCTWNCKGWRSLVANAM